MTVANLACRARCRFNVCATSASGAAAPGPDIQSASTAAADATRAAVLPETFSAETYGMPPAAATAVSGACSTTTCALVPLRPNDDTAALRGPAAAGHGALSVGTNSRVADASMAGFHRVKCKLRGMCPRCTASTALMNPATPAAASRWPMLVLTDPNAHGLSPWPLPRP
ncbi:Uncharacterised protein [Mycobacterium tuberculosis]|uniref:Uncharacterized protein n=2 Tax=Mycobacterium tuberculosis TaxID=1773 RepID=A0A655A3R7_MYCTX|nr:hypothetical protein FF22_01893 [Mycobacterium tuberculosis]CEZ57122.1 Uncharacterised protein [Mycobacterium tuberculosis]CFA16388.1 Uncharacterised protein [Mycobacterium tuberculosis]CFA27014.1 Uncharacterised protein [Mycobacterium tuberculosis]CFB23203.1 Uncharacterised protein [Mycobacterium tuberculosis]